jgi:hypothetical protein
MRLLYFTMGIIALRLLDILLVILRPPLADCDGYMELEYSEAYLWN